MILNLAEIGIAQSYQGTLTFMGETAGFRNTLGMYQIGPDGTISDVQILFANASQAGGGGDLAPGKSLIDIDFQSADSVGFFILSDGYGQSTGGLLSAAAGHFEFRNSKGALATVDDTSNPTLFYVDAAGKATAIKSTYSTYSFHSAASADNNYALNGDQFNHVRFSVLIQDGKALLKMAFEDLWAGGDKNYNDVVFELDIGAVNTVAIAPEVAALIPKILTTLDDEVHVSAKGVQTVNLLSNDTFAAGSDAHIVQIDGQAISEGQTITLSTGEHLTLGKNGEVSVEGSASAADVKVTYLVADSHNGLGTGILTIHTSPVDGTDGNDQMAVGLKDADGNMIDGTDGLSDVVMGYGGDDKITAGEGHDNIYGGTGDDFMRAGEGNDLIYGGDGNDVLDGQSGADSMYGGAGDDFYYIDDAKDTVSDVVNGGYDKVLSALSHVLGADFEELWLIEGTSATNATGNGLDNKIVGNANANTLLGLEGADQLFGMTGDDRLDGGAGNDNLYGGLGNDLVTGGEGNDKLYGGTGKDVLMGGAGNDTLSSDDGAVRLIGGTGNDLVAGGAGVDVFVFGRGDGIDTVKNFQHGQDVLEFSGLTLQNLTIKAVGTTVQISDGFGDTVILSGVSLASLDHNDFLFT